MGEERVVFVEGFAEAVAGVDGDAVALDAGGERGVEAVLEAGFDERQNFIFGERGQSAPFGGASASVHEDKAAVEARAGRGHLGIPEEAADVVDDFGSGVDGGGSGGGFPGVDGEQRVGPGFEDGFDDGKDAALLFFRGDGRVFARTCGFAADVDDVGSLLEHAEGVGGGCSGIEEAPAVGE